MAGKLGTFDRAAIAALAIESFPNSAIAVFDGGLRYLLADGGMEIPGLTTDTVEGKLLAEVLPPEAVALLEGPYRAAAVEGRETVLSVPYAERMYEVHVLPLTDATGAILGGMSVTREVTDELATRRSLDEAEQRFRSAFENAPIGIALVGLDGSWLRVNRPLSELLGYTEEELLSKSFQDLTHPDDLDVDLGYVAQMLSGEIRSYQMEKRYLRKNGSIVWALLSVSLVRGDEDEPRYFVSQIIDISERQRYEEQLTARAAELERANASLRAMDELKGDFIAIASHELKTPLTSVRGSLATLRARWSTLEEAERKELLEMANWQAERLHQLTDELLTLSRIESGILEVRPTTVLVRDIANEIVTYLAPSTEFRVTCDAAVAVSVDPAHLRQMLANYVTNAVKYGEPPYEIDVSTIGKMVELRVRDRGAGMAAEFVDRAFDKFSRNLPGASASGANVPGTGLGLSIVRGLAEANGGAAWYEGSEEGGVFALRLPAAT